MAKRAVIASDGRFSGGDNMGWGGHLNPTLRKRNCLFKSSGGSRIFPRGGREPSRGGVNTPNFPENCMKSKEFGRPGGGVRPSRPPLDPPMKSVNIPRLDIHT